MGLSGFQHRKGDRLCRNKMNTIMKRGLSLAVASVLCLSTVMTDIESSTVFAEETSEQSAEVPAAAVPETAAPETSAPETQAAAETSAPETQAAAETSAPETQTAAETSAPETQTAAETSAPESQAAGTETSAPESQTAAQTEQAQAAETSGTAQTNAEAEPETEIRYPALTLTAQTNEAKAADRVSITVKAPENSLPEGTTLEIAGLNTNRAADAAKIEKAEQISSLKSGPDKTLAGNETRLVWSRGVKVTFKDKDGAVIEPRTRVRITLNYDRLGESADWPEIVYVAENNAAGILPQALKQGLNSRGRSSQIVFDTDQTSTLVLVYSSLYRYPELSETLQEDETKALSDILDELKIPKADSSLVTLEDVAEVSSSDDSVISVTPSESENDYTVEALHYTDSEVKLLLTLSNSDRISIKVNVVRKETESETETGTEIITETEEAETEETETETGTESEAMPAQSFSCKVAGSTDTSDGSASKDDLLVSAKAPAGAFPEGTRMIVTPVEEEDVLNKIRKASGIQGGQDDTTDENTTRKVREKAVNITFLDKEGNEIEPLRPIRVSIAADEIAASGDKPQIIHVRDSGRAEVVSQTIHTDAAEEGRKESDSEISFMARQFSVYAVVYTVNFDYGDYRYILDGDASVTLSELLHNLKIAKDEEGTILTAEDVDDVTFSNPALVEVSRKENDWTLTAKRAFDTTEKLTLMLTNGDQISVAVTDDNETQLNPYITEVDAEKIVNGVWTPATEFADGESARITVNYRFGDNVVTATNRSVTYQLPDGVTVNEAVTDGIITNKEGTRIGSYTIDTNGKVTLTFDEDRVKDEKGFSGDISFEATVHNNSDENKHSINFGGTSSSITVTKPQESAFDIHTEKTGSFSDDKKTINYTIVTSTTKGTEGSVTITDKIDGNNTKNATFSYKENSIKVVKIDANGKTSDVPPDQYSKTVSGTEGDSNFVIANLPKLKAGERYEVTYQAAVGTKTVGQYAEIANTASSKSGSNEHWNWCSNKIQSSLQKIGWYDAASDLIYWTITVNPGKDTDVSRWTITDQTPAPIVGNVTIKNDSGSTVGTITDLDGKNDLNINLSEYIGNAVESQKKDAYYIEYATKAPEGEPGSSFTVKNTANATKDGQTVGTSTGKVDGTVRDWKVEKNHQSTAYTDLASGILHPQWSAAVTVPAGELTSFTYTDTFGDVKDAGGKVVEGAEHYTTAGTLEKELEGHLQLVVDDHLKYVYKGPTSTSCENQGRPSESSDIRIHVTFYDQNGNKVEANNSYTHIKRFTVEVKNMQEGNGFKARSLVTGTYSSIFDIHGMPEGDTWKVTNRASVRDVSDEAEYSYTKPERFLKQVKTGSQNNADVFDSGTTTVDYNDMNGQLTYRLLLSTNKQDEGTITVTDTLPEGVKYVEGSLQARFFKSEYDRHPTNYAGSDFNSNSKPKVTTTQNDDGTTRSMTIEIPDYHYSSEYPTVEIQYTVSLAEDPAWEDMTLTEKDYTNTAEWGNSKDSSETKVTREREKIIKSGKQLTDDDGKPYGRIRYTVVINPAGLDLDPDSNTLTLTDSLSSGNLAAYNPSLDISSVRLYNYDADRDDHIGTEIANTSYSMKYDSAASKVVLQIPDSKALILVYEYQLDENYTNGTVISNSAELSGQGSGSSNIEMKTQSSSAHASRDKLDIYKIDSRNNQITLPGVEFTLDRYDRQTGWTSVQKDGNATLTTDEGGKLEWIVSGENPGLKPDTLYRLTETKAPEGYKKNSEPSYFIWKARTSSDDTAYTNSGAQNITDGAIQKNQIRFIGYRGGNMYIENTYTRVGVQKTWTNPDGSEIGTPEGTSVQVQLYQQTLKPDGYTVTTTTKSSQSDNSQTSSVIVKKDSSLTISFQDWEDANPGNNQPARELYVTYGGVSKSMIYGSNGIYSYTIPKVESDMNITITVRPYNALSVNYSGYTKAPDVAVNRQAYGTPVTLSADSATGKLSYSWDNLPQEDASSNKYYYTVEEVSVTQNGMDVTKNFGVSYSNNDGIQSGQIIITNTKPETPPEEVNLPSSGGPGSSRYIGNGIILVLLAAFLYIIGQQLLRRKEGGAN